MEATLTARSAEADSRQRQPHANDGSGPPQREAPRSERGANRTSNNRNPQATAPHQGAATPTPAFRAADLDLRLYVAVQLGATLQDFYSQPEKCAYFAFRLADAFLSEWRGEFTPGAKAIRDDLAQYERHRIESELRDLRISAAIARRDHIREEERKRAKQEAVAI